MSTTFNFPANPNVGDFFTLPNGTIAQWNGSEWVSVAEGAVTYPLPINLGGTGAATAALARQGLGLDAATGQRQLPDGTVAAPGLAFASELGLGWYRKAASVLGLASQGVQIGEWDATVATGTSYKILSRDGTKKLDLGVFANGSYLRSFIDGVGGREILTDGMVMLSARVDPLSNGVATGVADANFGMVKGAGRANQILGYTGGSGPANLRWALRPGGYDAESGGAGSYSGSQMDFTAYDNAGGNGRIIASLSRTGTLSFNSRSSAPTLTFAIEGGTVTGALLHYPADSRTLLLRDQSNWGNGSVQLFSNKVVLSTANGADFSFVPNGGGLMLQGAKTTGAAASVAAVWEGDRHSYCVVTSARRFKKDFVALPGGALDKVMLLKPLTYVSAIEGDLPERQPGFVAEDFVDAGLPEYVTYQDGEVQSLKYDRITALLAKALQEVNTRLAALEAP